MPLPARTPSKLGRTTTPQNQEQSTIRPDHDSLTQASRTGPRDCFRAQPAGLCLVDTGVNVNPDTESVVVDRTAIDGGSGNDVSPTTHGTLLAMMAGAPANGWGMVGTAPHSIQIVSVRILEPGQTTFPFGYYTDGITT